MDQRYIDQLENRDWEKTTRIAYLENKIRTLKEKEERHWEELQGLRNVKYHFWNYEGDPKQDPGHNFQHWITEWMKPENWNR